MKRKVIGIILILSLLAGCGGAKEQKAPKLIDNKSASSAIWTVKRGTISNTKAATGVGTYKMDSYGFITEGSVSEVLVNMGDKVKKGQLLACRDTTEIDAKIRDLRQDISFQVTSNKYTLEQMKEDKSKQGKETYRYTKKKQETNLANLREQLSLAEKERKNHLIYSHTNGEVVYVRNLAEKCEVAAQECIVLVADKSQKRIIMAGSSEAERSDMEEAKRATLHDADKTYNVSLIPFTKSELSIDGDINDTSESGSKKLLSPRFSVKGIFDKIEVGQYYPMEFTKEEYKNVLYVPNECIQKSGFGKDSHAYVYVKDGNLAKQQEVKLGSETTNFTVVLSGLNEGDVISRPVKNVADLSAAKATIKRTNFKACIEIADQVGISYPVEKNQTVDYTGAVLQDLYVENDQKVKKGQKIATLRVDIGKGQIAELENQILTTKVSMNSEISHLQKEYNKKKSRMNEIALKQKKLEKSHQLQMLQNQLNDVRKTRGTIDVYADISGSVDKLTSVKKGRSINMGERICSIVDEDYVICKVVDQLGLLHYGTPVEVYAFGDEKKKNRFHGKVIFGNEMKTTLPVSFGEEDSEHSVAVSYVLFKKSDCLKVGKIKHPILRANGVNVSNVLVVDKKAVFSNEGVGDDYIWVWENNKYVKKYVMYMNSFKGVSGTSDTIVSWVFSGAKDGDEVAMDDRNKTDGKIEIPVQNDGSQDDEEDYDLDDEGGESE